MEELDELERLAGDVPQFRPILETEATQIRQFLESAKIPGEAHPCYDVLEERLADLDNFSTALRDFAELREELRPEQLRRDLIAYERVVASKTDEEIVWLSWFLLVAAAIVLVYALYRRLGDPKGRTELQEIVSRDNYNELLEFLIQNGYSLQVNKEAIGYLRPMVPLTADGLEHVSNAAARRFKRGPGLLNEDVGRLLQQVAKGIDNVLNRPKEPLKKSEMTRGEDGKNERDDTGHGV